MIRFRSQGLVWFALLVCSLFSCSLVGCGSGGTDNIIPSLSGVQGKATRWPLSPQSVQGQSDSAPLPDVVIAVRRVNGSEVARQTTDSQGNYKIGVAPGTYRVEGIAPNAGSNLPPYPRDSQTVTVTANQYMTVNVSYDTGIR